MEAFWHHHYVEPVQEPPFSCCEAPIDAGRVVMELEGELDMFVCPTLASRFHELAEEGTRDVVVDLNDVRFIDTHALTTLVSAQQEFEDHEHRLAVVAASPYARRTLELTGLDEKLRVARSRDEAVARLET
ncbi:MAG TPA: STAS domain-containing protein [Thermoleophilaceae bacterium]|jgi:anti-anti-sigma factor|nr:STAS domain-containing protein [Thermoleophilaceae bacterium]